MTTATPETYPSFRALVRQVLQSALPRPQKAVLQALLAYARYDLTVYHAQGQLAWACDYTRPVIKQALAALKAQAILRVLQRPHQHHATEYAIDLSRLPSRTPYGSQAITDGEVSGDGTAISVQGANDLPAEELTPVIQPIRDLPTGELGGKSVPPSGQLGDPQVVQGVSEKIFFSCDESTPPRPYTGRGNDFSHAPRPRRPRPVTMRPPETPTPETLPLTDALHRWAADTVPGLSLERERDKFLCYARAHGLTHVDWSEALKLWWLEAHARAVRRGTLQLPTTPGPTTVPEPPPVYDVELHRQIKADIARLCGPAGPLMVGMNDHQGLRRRRVPLMPTTEGVALERDPAYLAQMQARKAMLQAQVALLQTQAPCVGAAGAAD
jgi:hypothetical protein